MARKTAHSSKTQNAKASNAKASNARASNAKAALTPRQVALVLPHASAAAGPNFESALETLGGNLTVHKLWQTAPAGKSGAK